MNWYNVELHSQDPLSSQIVTYMHAFTVTKTIATVEAEDEAGAMDEALYKFKRYYGDTRRKPQIYKVELLVEYR